MNRVRKFRKDAGISQTQLARMTGLPVNTIATLERRNSNLQKMTASLISEALNVPVPVLIGREEEKQIWKDGEYLPDKNGEYIVAYRNRPYTEYHYRVLTFKNDLWWETTKEGQLISAFRPGVLWWSDIATPPV